MRTAENVLAIIRERGHKGLPLEDIYRQLFNPNLYLLAYSRIYSNDGAMTPGVTKETADGMSLAKIESIITNIRQETYRWTPVRRILIPKTNGKTRPLGISTWSDKLLQEVIRLLLEAYYEPQLSPNSHGFRPGRGCETALTSITNWSGTKWFIEGDVAKYFDTICHTKLLSILRENLKDNRFIRLIENLLKAGYLEDWKYNHTLSGTPQGSGVSPILANIFLDKFDKYVENELIPQYTRGKRRATNLKYQKLQQKIQRLRKKGEVKQAHKLWVELQKMPAGDPNDPNFRRLRYVRYADDTLWGYIGTKAEAEEIKQKIKDWLQSNLELELSDEKTLITHASTEAAKFLGYAIVTQHADCKHDKQGHRHTNGTIGLRVSADVIKQKCARYMQRGKAAHRNELINDDDFSIIRKYQNEYRGIVNYYMLALNVGWFHKLRYIMETSLLKTLARKHKTSLMAMVKKYKAPIVTPHGPMAGLRLEAVREGKPPLVAQFGGIPLRRDKKAVLRDINPQQHFSKGGRTEILKRLLANECELCGSTEKVEVHHIRKLADLKKNGRKEKPAWVQRMAARQRKTLMVCHKCHTEIHAGKSQKSQTA